VNVGERPAPLAAAKAKKASVPVDIHLENVGDVAVLEPLSEALDASNSKDLKAQLAAIFPAHRKVLLDLGQVDFVDSTGCGAIIASLISARNAGAELKLCNSKGKVRTLFELVRMHHILDIFETREQAVAAFAR
jgi:anti-sigma B factor antagonist